MNIEIIMDDGHRYVREELLSNVLDRMAALIKDQRTALRTHNRDMIDDCKRRENGLLKYVEDYHKAVEMSNQLKIFEDK